jgi:hypothetical protein
MLSCRSALIDGEMIVQDKNDLLGPSRQGVSITDAANETKAARPMRDLNEGRHWRSSR